MTPVEKSVRRPFGAHVPGGSSRLIQNASACGADVAQIFASNPRGWATPAISNPSDASVRDALGRGRLAGLFLHAPYLVNLATSDDGFRERSTDSLAWTMRRAGELGAGVVVHAGAAGAAPRDTALDRVREALSRALDADDRPALVVELTAGGRGTMASTWPEAAEVLNAVGGSPRVRLCFDTCHALAAGYDLRAPEGMIACLEEMSREVGPERLALIHANDARDPVGSRRDRHWHIGKGTIGPEPFRALLQAPGIGTVPVVVETPGTLEDHARNVAMLRSLATSPDVGAKRPRRRVSPAGSCVTRRGQKA